MMLFRPRGAGNEGRAPPPRAVGRGAMLKKIQAKRTGEPLPVATTTEPASPTPTPTAPPPQSTMPQRPVVQQTPPPSDAESTPPIKKQPPAGVLPQQRPIAFGRGRGRGRGRGAL